MLEISFPNKSTHDAGMLAKQLRSSLVSSGVPDSRITLRKASDDTMDVGSLLQIDWATLLHGTHMSLLVVAIAKSLWEITVPAKSSVSIKTKKRTIVLEVDEIDAEKLQELLTTVTQDEQSD